MSVNSSNTKKKRIVWVIIVSLILIIILVRHTNETVINRGVRHFGRIEGKYTIQLQYNIMDDIGVALIDSNPNLGFVVYRKTPHLPFYKYEYSIFSSGSVVHREEGHRAHMVDLSFNPIKTNLLLDPLKDLFGKSQGFTNEEVTVVVFKSESDSFNVSYETYKPDVYIIKQPYTILIWTKRTDEVHKLFTDYIPENR